MAYELKELKVIPGGLNLAAPGDQVATGDCLDLTGFWPSAVGKLQQTKGWTPRNSGSINMVVHSISEAEQRIYYGGGENLYQVGRDAGFVPATIDDNYDSSPLGLLGFQGFMWIANRAKMRKDDGTTTSDWGVEAPASGPSLGTATTGELLDGDYEYYVTFIDLNLDEGNPSPVTNQTLSGGDNGEVTITRPSAADASLILRWNVYRKSPGTSEILLLNFDTILPYATTTHVDAGTAALQQTDDDLIGNGEILETDHDDPPLARVLGNAPFNGRLLLASSDEFPNRLWYTKSDQPGFVPADNYIDIGADRGDAILGISVKKGFFIVYRQRSIWVHFGDFDDDNPRVEPLVPEMGTLGIRSWCSTSQADYFAWRNSVYKLTDWATDIGQKIQPVFEEFVIENFDLLYKLEQGQCALGFNNGRLWFSYPAGDLSEFPTHTLILDQASDRWFARTWTYGGFACFYVSSEFFLAGDAIGNVQSLEDGLTDGYGGGVWPIPLAYQSAYEDCGLPDREKTWADLVIDHNTQGAELDVIIKTNKLRTGGGVDEFTLATLDSVTATRETIPLFYPADYVTVAKRNTPIKAHNLSVRIAGDGPEAGFCSIDTPILLHYYLEARYAQTFDSGLTDLGTKDVKAVDQIELDIDTAELVLVQVYSDFPGGIMTYRETLIIPATSGRQVFPVLLAAEREGRLFRFQVVAFGAQPGFQLYGMRVRVLPIGIYLDGTIADAWDSEPMASGA